MALIENQTQKEKSAYTRLFGIELLGKLITKIHGTIIVAGTELEKEIYSCAKLKIEDIDHFLDNQKEYERAGIWMANKKAVKKSQRVSKSYEPDFLGFDVLRKILYIFEVKAGHNFDTKKASAEHKTLYEYRNLVSGEIPFETKVYISCFDVETKEEARAGLKNKFALEEILTGREFCELVDIRYERIVKERKVDQQKNREYFVREILKIPQIKKMISKRIKSNKQ